MRVRKERSEEKRNESCKERKRNELKKERKE